MKKKFFFFIINLWISFYIFSQNYFPLLSLPQEDPKSLYSYSKDNTNIEFYADGFWNMGLKQNFFLAFDVENKTGLNPPVFSQNIELSVWFLLNNHWYFESAFAEGFDKNTIAIGYYGDSFLKHLRIGNRGIHFTNTFTHTSFSQDENETPGILGEFKYKNLHIESFVRLESTRLNKKTFIGNNSLSNKIEDYEWARGQFFHLSSNYTPYINDIFVEDEKGDYTSNDFPKKHFRKLSKEEYLVYSSQSLVYLTKQNTGIIIFALSTKDNDTLKSDFFNTLGFFNDTSSGTNKTYLKTIQEAFTEINSGEKFDLGDYAFAGSKINDENFFVELHSKIQNEEIEKNTIFLLVQEPGFFSPFENAAFYISKNIQLENAKVFSINTNTETDLFYVEIEDNSNIFNFSEIENIQTILHISSAFQTNFETSQFPFAKLNPNLYLQNFNEEESLYFISFESENQKAAVYPISKKALLGTIEVYINGIKSNNFTYNKQNGEVEIQKVLSDTDRIEIYWKEETFGFENASINSALGFLWNFDTLNMQLILSGNIPLLQEDSFSTIENSLAAEFKTTFDIDYAFKNDLHSFTLENYFTYTMTKPNLSDYFQIDGMNDESKTNYLSKDAVKTIEELYHNISLNLKDPIVQNQTQLAKKHFRKSNVSQKTDTEITGYVFNIEAEFQEAENWSLVELDLSNQDNIISKAEFFSLALKNNCEEEEEFDVYLQLGSSLGDGSSENYENKIATWKISKETNSTEDDPFVTNYFVTTGNENWQIIRVSLTKLDRSFLTKNSVARIILVKKENLNNPIEIEIEIGPYEISPHSFSLEDESFTSTDAQTWSFYAPINKSLISRFNQNRINKAQAFFWQETSPQDPIIFKKSIVNIPLFEYKKLGFFYAIPEENIDLTNNAGLKKLSISFFEEGKILTEKNKILEIEIDFEKLIEENIIDSSPNWKQVEFDLENNRLFIENKKISNEYFKIIQGKKAYPNEIAIQIETTETGSGSVYIDEIYLFEASIQQRFSNDFSFIYFFTPSIKINNFPLLEKINIELTSHQALIPINSWYENNLMISTFSKASLNFRLMTFDIKTNYSFLTDSEKEKPINFDAFNYSISSTPEFKLFNYVYINESFSFAPNILTSAKNNILEIKIPKSFLFFDLRINGNTNASFTKKKAKQNANFLTEISIPIENAKLIFESNILLDQILTNKFQNIFSENYQELFFLQLSNGENAKERKENLNFKTIFNYNSFKPELQFNNSFFQNPDKKLSNSKTDFLFLIPFKINIIDIKLKHSKSFTLREENVLNNNYQDDISFYFENLSEYQVFFSSFSIVDLFPSYLEPNEFWGKRPSGEIDSQEYFTSYGFDIKRKLFLSPIDLMIPSSLEFNLNRKILILDERENKDYLQYLGKLSYTAFNSFGIFGSKKIFSWYEQDEFFGYLQVKINQNLNDKDFDFTIRFFEQINLYIFENNNVQESFDFIFTNPSQFSLYFSLAWQRDGKNSFIKPLIENYIKQNESPKLLRKNAFQYSLEAKTENLHAFQISHGIETKLNKNLSILSNLDASLIFTDRKMKSIELNAEIAAQLNF